MDRAQNTDPIVSKIVNRWQITVPVEIRALYGLVEGDMFEWKFNPDTSALTLIPKRAQLITPRVIAHVEDLRNRRAEQESRTKKTQEPEPALTEG